MKQLTEQLSDSVKHLENDHSLSRALLSSEISWLPKQVKKTYTGDYRCLLVPYKTARVDMDILDDAVGPQRWQTEFKRDSKDILQCGIGIYYEEDWVWKWYNGMPSSYEKEKGEYSDAFKRAGFMWGIGRELYSYPVIWIILNEEEVNIGDNGEAKTTFKFKPESWVWVVKKTESGKIWVIASQWFGQRKVERFNSNSLNSKNPRK